MKRRFLFASVLVTLVGVVFVMRPASAQQADAPVMTEAHIQHIKASCGDALRTIQQLHTNDALLRVDRGQLYETISAKLMARLSSRLATNNIDAVPFVKISTQYDKVLAEFRVNYKRYDDQMSAVLLLDCTRQPVAFYDAVAKARALRSATHANIIELNRLTGEYEKVFDTFYTNYKAKGVNG